MTQSTGRGGLMPLLKVKDWIEHKQPQSEFAPIFSFWQHFVKISDDGIKCRESWYMPFQKELEWNMLKNSYPKFEINLGTAFHTVNYFQDTEWKYRIQGEVDLCLS